MNMETGAEVWKAAASMLARHAVACGKCPAGVEDEVCLAMRCHECWLVAALREAAAERKGLSPDKIKIEVCPAGATFRLP